jgi:hypothetical protein
MAKKEAAEVYASAHSSEMSGSFPDLGQRLWRRHVVSPGMISSAVSLRSIQRLGQMGANQLPLLTAVQQRWLPVSEAAAIGQPLLRKLPLAGVQATTYTGAYPTAYNRNTTPLAAKPDARPVVRSGTVQRFAAQDAPPRETHRQPVLESLPTDKLESTATEARLMSRPEFRQITRPSGENQGIKARPLQLAVSVQTAPDIEGESVPLMGASTPTVDYRQHNQPRLSASRQIATAVTDMQPVQPHRTARLGASSDLTRTDPHPDAPPSFAVLHSKKGSSSAAAITHQPYPAAQRSPFTPHDPGGQTPQHMQSSLASPPPPLHFPVASSHSQRHGPAKLAGLMRPFSTSQPMAQAMRLATPFKAVALPTYLTSQPFLARTQARAAPAPESRLLATTLYPTNAVVLRRSPSPAVLPMLPSVAAHRVAPALLPTSAPLATQKVAGYPVQRRIASLATALPGNLSSSERQSATAVFPHQANPVPENHNTPTTMPLAFMLDAQQSTRLQSRADSPVDAARSAAASSISADKTSELPSLTADWATEQSPATNTGQLVDQVYDLLVQRLAAERERRGW